MFVAAPPKLNTLVIPSILLLIGKYPFSISPCVYVPVPCVVAVAPDSEPVIVSPPTKVPVLVCSNNINCAVSSAPSTTAVAPDVPPVIVSAF